MAGDYDTKVQDTELDAIAEIYKFEQSGKTPQYYTSYHKPVVFEGNTYYPATIDRDQPSYDNSFSEVSMEITAPITDEFRKYAANGYPRPITFVLVKKFFINDEASNETIFDGKIKRVVLQGKEATVKLASADDIFELEFPQRTHQRDCNNTLFDNTCGLLRSNFETAVTATIIGNTLVHPDFIPLGNDYFKFGHVNLSDGSDSRMIMSHIGDTLTLRFPFDTALSSIPVKVYPGCDKTEDTCKNKFNNFENNTGYADIPGDQNNPVFNGF